MQDLESCGLNSVWVRIPPLAPKHASVAGIGIRRGFKILAPVDRVDSTPNTGYP